MELTQLRYALAIVDTGSFTEAARTCFVAQPSLSQSVRKLERELGVVLFERIGRGVGITAAGHAFAQAARTALRAVDSVRTEVDAVRGLVAGDIHLVSLPTLAVEPVTPLVGAFRAAHPRVVVRLAHPDGTADLIESVRDGHSEIGITVLPLEPAGLTVHRLGRQEIVVVLPPGHARRTAMDAAALEHLSMVTNPIGTSTRTLLDAVFADAERTPSIAVETDQREAIIPLVVAGAGAALLPRPMAAVASLQGCAVVSLAPKLWRDLVLVHRDNALSPAARAFVEIALASR